MTTEATPSRLEMILGLGDGLDTRDVPCPYCSAKVGEWCWVWQPKHAATGPRQMAYDQHEARGFVLQGYRRALVDVQEALDGLLKRDREAN